jgi:hypothetical protein
MEGIKKEEEAVQQEDVYYCIYTDYMARELV